MASIEKIPPEAEAKIRKLRELQAALEKFLREKTVLQASLTELERVIGEVEALPDDAEVYKFLGTVLVRVEKKKLLEELKERKESTELKLKTLEEAIKNVESELKRLEDEVRRLLSGGAAPAGG